MRHCIFELTLVFCFYYLDFLTFDRYFGRTINRLIRHGSFNTRYSHSAWARCQIWAPVERDRKEHRSYHQGPSTGHWSNDDS